MNKSRKILIIVFICVFIFIVGALYFKNLASPKSYGPVDSNVYDLEVNNKNDKKQNTITESSNSSDTSKQNTKDDSFTNKARQEFIDVCVNKDQTSDVCACAADYIHNKYSPSEILNMYYEYKKANQIPAEVKSAVDSCKK